ncbi:E3 ubiquitin-protein ligase E3D isoform X1 [Scleropages formosus]|uniref:E3 ubiquitin-protein ligase E3D isoform X1 n=1 Tax=Scleropages formosus TaxID=113540 RepID=UPI0010FA83CA|nr:E3 ubiquitin-protein ligase E3D isoform X1 [Scleropages formosus]
MAEKQPQVRLFMELRQRLKSGLLILRSDVAGNPAEVDVSSADASLLIKTPTEVLRVLLPPGVTLLMGSCSGAPAATGEGLHLRLRLQVDQQTEPPGSILGQLQVQDRYCFSCQVCSKSLLTHRSFSRVLPLPNGNWNMLITDWCCHPDPFANKKLLPRSGDCLLGDTFFLLPRDRESDGQLIQEPVQTADSTHKAGKIEVVMCGGCRAVLGEAISGDALKLYITEVTVRQSDKHSEDDMIQHRWHFLEHTLAARLVELSYTQSMFRFSIQTPSGKTFILLWLLNTDSLLAFLSDTAVGSEASNSGHRLGGKLQSCRATSAAKVLYLPCVPSMHQEITDAWEKDVGVHPLTLPQSTCQEVLQLLRASTSSLPPSLQSMNSYQVIPLSSFAHQCCAGAITHNKTHCSTMCQPTGGGESSVCGARYQLTAVRK